MTSALEEAKRWSAEGEMGHLETTDVVVGPGCNMKWVKGKKDHSRVFIMPVNSELRHSNPAWCMTESKGEAAQDNAGVPAS